MGKYQINREVSYYKGPVIELIPGETGIIRHVELDPTKSVIYFQQSGSPEGSPLDQLSLDNPLDNFPPLLKNLDEDQLRILSMRYHFPMLELIEVTTLEKEYRGIADSEKTGAKTGQGLPK